MTARRTPFWSMLLSILFLIILFPAGREPRATLDDDWIAYGKKEKHYQRLKEEGRYDELVSAYLIELQSEKEKGRLYPQIRINNEIGRVYLNRLKNYSKAIGYGELALDLIEEGIELGPENEPDDCFFPFVIKTDRKKHGQ